MAENASEEIIPIVAVGPDDDQERTEWLEALARTVDQRAFCLGSEVVAFETRVREELGVHDAIGVSSGTDALIVSLAAAGVGTGDEVIVPAFSFFASASSVAHLGARPRFVDVTADTLTIDAKATAAALTEKTRAIMPVHLYGQAVEHFVEVLDLAREHDLAVIEDAAQVFGIRYRDRALGSFGAAGCFSFYPTKNLGAPGDAGMVIAEDEEMAQRVRALRVHGDRGGYQHEVLGFNARMDGFQAAILSVKLDRLAAMQEARSRNAECYLAALDAAGLLDRVRPLRRVEGSGHGWHQFIVRIENRDAVRAALGERGIQSAVYYPTPLPHVPAFRELGHRPGDFPEAEAGAREVLALPIHHRLESEDPERVVDALRAILS